MVHSSGNETKMFEYREILPRPKTRGGLTAICNTPPPLNKINLRGDAACQLLSDCIAEKGTDMRLLENRCNALKNSVMRLK